MEHNTIWFFWTSTMDLLLQNTDGYNETISKEFWKKKSFYIGCITW